MENVVLLVPLPVIQRGFLYGVVGNGSAERFTLHQSPCCLPCLTVGHIETEVGPKQVVKQVLSSAYTQHP